MILTVEKDRDRLLEYWQEERSAPKWYRKWCEIDDVDEERFLKFCARHTVYEVNGNALLYVKKETRRIVSIHFTVKRGAKDFSDLWEIREHLFGAGVHIIHGYILRQNWPLKRLCRAMGMHFNGLLSTDEKGMTAECYAIHKYEIHPPTLWQKMCLNLKLKVLSFR